MVSECVNTLNKYENCLMKNELEIVNLDYFCRDYYTDRCQQLLNNGTKSIPACQNTRIQSELTSYDTFLEIVSFYKRFHCAKDENGNYCPFNVMDSENRRIEKIDNGVKVATQSEKEFYKYVDKTCQSKNCTKTFLNYTEENERIAKLIEIHNNQIGGESSTLSKRFFSTENFKNQSGEVSMQKAIEYLKSEECTKLGEEFSQELQQEESQQSQNLNESAAIILNNCNTHLTIFILMVSVVLLLIQ
ncbi:hypothetical protein PIROE2DRAFT_18443 [Piromyces sp. E2]|nr:hypothetical protein PIROE2DRAFT_18443 [Piromyces sp. E2]|eukprot:OUM56799.1 hypothetical protein PIROE2DRAFT_18443 [Piromyces sp. E2]